jgi:putative oxidoreductase
VLRRTDDLALLMGRVFVAALFLPHGLHKLMNFWSFAASLGANGVPYSNAIAVLAVVAEILGPLTLIIGLWPRWTVGIGRAHPPQKLRQPIAQDLWGAVFLPRRNVELYRNLAILGGLLFYFVSGPGAWSLGRGTSRRA